MAERSDPIDDAAAGWFALLRDDAATAQDRAGFAAWLDADPRHREAWRQMLEIWAGMDGLRPAPQARRSQQWGKVAALAAAAILFFAGAGFWTLQPAGFVTALFADHRAGVGGMKSILLPDGSTLVLGAASAASIAFDGSTRRVILHQGEGFFTVTADPARPFVVEAGGGRITVVGTQFDVKFSGEEVAVAVAAGVVEVSAPVGDPVTLRQGQSVRFGAAGTQAIDAVAAADVGFWRQGRLIFQSVPLGEVLKDLERYRGGRILAPDANFAALPVTGVFDPHRADAALGAIAQTLRARLVTLAGFVVLVLPPD